MRMSRGPSSRKEKPREAVSSWWEETPRSASRPSTRETPCWARRDSTSWKLPASTLKREPKRASLSAAARRASGSRSMPHTVAPCSSRSSVCPPPPSVQSTMSLPGAAASMSTVSCSRTVMWRKFPAEPSSPSCGAGAATVSASPISAASSSSLAPTSGAFRASAWYALSQFTAGARAFQEQTSSSTPISPVSSAITWTWLRQMLQASRRQAVLAEIPSASAWTASVRIWAPAPARKESSTWSSKARFRSEDNAPSLP